MASVQYETVCMIPHEQAKPVIDTASQTGVPLQEAARVHVTPALAEVRRAMNEVRASGKCGIVVARWDGQAWSISKTTPPCRVNE